MSTPRGRPREHLWTRDYVLATVINLFVAVIFYELMTTTALYAVERFHSAGVAAGLAVGAFMIGAMASRLLIGKQLDIIGRRRILIFALAACVVLPLLYGVVDSWWLLVVIRALHGAGFGAGSTAVSTGALALVPSSRRGEGAGYYGLAPVLAAALGAVLGASLVNTVSYPALFISSAICASAALGLALVIRLPERTPTDEDRRNARRWNPTTLVDAPSAALSSIILVASVGFSSVLAFLNSYSASEGLGQAAGAYFLIYALTALVARMIIGRAQDVFGERVVIPPLLAALAIGLGAIAIAPAGVALLVSGVLVGFGFGALFPVVHAAVFSAARPERVAIATSTFYLMGDAGIGFGPPVAGALIPLLGFSGVYMALAAATFTTIVVYLLIEHRMRLRQR